MSVPADYSVNDTVMQIKQFDLLPDVVGKPSVDLASISQHAYDIKALAEDGTLVSEFDEPISVTIKYADAEIIGVDESTLTIYHLHDATWSSLEECAVNATINTVTCTSTQFSLFALFGVPVPATKPLDSEPSTDQGRPSEQPANGPAVVDANSNKVDEKKDEDAPGPDEEKVQDVRIDDENGQEETSHESLLWWFIGVAAIVIFLVVLTQQRKVE